MLKLNNLKSPKGAHKNIKRIGRGEGSGQGTQAGKGHKGQKARSGGGVRTGFEGGGLPLYMRLPKWGTFTNARFKKEFSVVNLEAIAKKFESGAEIGPDELIKKGLIKKGCPVKILAKGEKLKATFKFKGIKKFSKQAEEQIKACGGTVE